MNKEITIRRDITRGGVAGRMPTGRAFGRILAAAMGLNEAAARAMPKVVRPCINRCPINAAQLYDNCCPDLRMAQGQPDFQSSAHESELRRPNHRNAGAACTSERLAEQRNHTPAAGREAVEHDGAAHVARNTSHSAAGRVCGVGVPAHIAAAGHPLRVRDSCDAATSNEFLASEHGAARLKRDRCFSLFGVVHQLVDDEASVEMVTADVIQEFHDDGAACWGLNCGPHGQACGIWSCAARQRADPPA